METTEKNRIDNQNYQWRLLICRVIEYLKLLKRQHKKWSSNLTLLYISTNKWALLTSLAGQDSVFAIERLFLGFLFRVYFIFGQKIRF